MTFYLAAGRPFSVDTTISFRNRCSSVLFAPLWPLRIPESISGIRRHAADAQAVRVAEAVESRTLQSTTPGLGGDFRSWRGRKGPGPLPSRNLHSSQNAPTAVPPSPGTLSSVTPPSTKWENWTCGSRLITASVCTFWGRKSGERLKSFFTGAPQAGKKKGEKQDEEKFKISPRSGMELQMQKAVS